MTERRVVLMAVSIALVMLPVLVARAGSPSDPLCFGEAYFDIGLDRANAVAVGPGGNHVYVAGYSDHGVSVFRVDAATGRLVFVEMHQDGINGVDGLAGPTCIRLSPDGGHLYVASNPGDAIAIFGRATIAGMCTCRAMMMTPWRSSSGTCSTCHWC